MKVNVKETEEKTNSNNKTTRFLEDPKINVKLKLAALWTALVFFYLYNDVITFFRQDHVEEVLTGELAGIEVGQTFLLGAAILMSIPIFMIFLSLALPAKVNRPTNIIVGLFHAVLFFASLVGPGEPWAHFALYMVFEAVFILIIVWFAWTWPKLEISR
jgi:hypothetical protein